MIRKPQVHTKAAAFQIALKRWLSRYQGEWLGSLMRGAITCPSPHARVTPSLMRGAIT